MRKIFLPLLLLLVLDSLAQPPAPQRYRDAVYEQVAVQKDLSYAPDGNTGRSFRFDLYQPADDTATKRPLIIWMHGGGFALGSKSAPGIELWCRQFAQKGYVSAGLNYPLAGLNTLFSFSKMKIACYGAVKQVAQAIDYFRNAQQQYRIDTTRIILAGNSAGAVIALQAAFAEPEQLARFCGVPYDGEYHKQDISAVINFWGAIFKIGWLQQKDIPLLNVFGSEDRIVPPSPRENDTAFYGGRSLRTEATRLRMRSETREYAGYAHELQKHFNPVFPVGTGTRKRWEEAGELAAAFLFKNLFTY